MGNPGITEEVGFSIENGKPYVLLRKNEEDAPRKTHVPSLIASMAIAIAAEKGIEDLEDETVTKLLMNCCISDAYDTGTYFTPIMCAPKALLFVHDTYAGTMSVEVAKEVLLGMLGGDMEKFNIVITAATESLAEVVKDFADAMKREDTGRECETK